MGACFSKVESTVTVNLSIHYLYSETQHGCKLGARACGMLTLPPLFSSWLWGWGNRAKKAAAQICSYLPFCSHFSNLSSICHYGLLVVKSTNQWFSPPFLPIGIWRWFRKQPPWLLLWASFSKSHVLYWSRTQYVLLSSSSSSSNYSKKFKVRGRRAPACWQSISSVAYGKPHVWFLASPVTSSQVAGDNLRYWRAMASLS